MENKSVFVWVLGLAVVGIFFFSRMTGFSVIGASDFEIPMSEIGNEAKYYEVDGIEFFVVRDSSGEIKTAFNACDVCFGAKKGYSQDGDFMVCNNCGNRYPIAGLGVENDFDGGCWPGYLPNKIKGEGLIIKKSDIEQGRYRFE
jgi:hypothetical protein